MILYFLFVCKSDHVTQIEIIYFYLTSKKLLGCFNLHKKKQ
jgi:hypothetical protein